MAESEAASDEDALFQLERRRAGQTIARQLDANHRRRQLRNRLLLKLQRFRPLHQAITRLAADLDQLVHRTGDVGTRDQTDGGLETTHKEWQ